MTTTIKDYCKCCKCSALSTLEEQPLIAHGDFSTHSCPQCGHEDFYQAKPLFIPLKTEFYEAFANGTKTKEYRAHSKYWNEKNCKIGRPVTLSKGYGKQQRLNAVIKRFRVIPAKHLGPDTFESLKAIYGLPMPSSIAVIELDVIGGEA